MLFRWALAGIGQLEGAPGGLIGGKGPPRAGTRGPFASNKASRGALELPNACQGRPKQYENMVNSIVLARCPFSLKVILLIDPLAKLGPPLTQTGVQWAPWQGRQTSKMDAKATHGAKP